MCARVRACLSVHMYACMHVYVGVHECVPVCFWLKKHVVTAHASSQVSALIFSLQQKRPTLS
jgi:hypothetical protein